MTHISADILRRLRVATESFVQDLRHAMRHLRRGSGPAAAMVAILSLVMTAGATLTGVTNAIVFRALPVADPHRLAAVSMTDSQAGGVRLFHYETFRQFVEQQSILDGTFAFRGGGLLDLRYGDTESQGLIAAVTPGFFDTLGLTRPPAGSTRRWTHRPQGNPRASSCSRLERGSACAEAIPTRSAARSLSAAAH